jgi:hypothetical protein
MPLDARQKRILFFIIIAQIPSVLHALTQHEPYHTSALSGEQWVQELLHGHPKRIHQELGVHKEVFDGLVTWLRKHNHVDSRHVTLHEQLAIFLYMARTGLSTRHVGERFQHNVETISRCVISICFIM